ncbi:hypothetical protein [Cohnella yongneupensis]|uniref:Phage tail protein n=1 Tax=Cohnella yongneupensis TaxID=425006 RepID=A0ABW0QUL0_9BACL
MATDVTKIKLGPCKVIFDVLGTPITLETTQGGVTLVYEETDRDVKTDQYGDTPAKKIITGRNARFEVPFAEYDLDKLTRMIPGSTLIINGPDPTKKRVVVNAGSVIDLLDYAKQVKLIPLAAGTTENESVTLYKAAPRPKINYKYDYNGERISNVTFEGFPDSNANLIAFGDMSA